MAPLAPSRISWARFRSPALALALAASMARETSSKRFWWAVATSSRELAATAAGAGAGAGASDGAGGLVGAGGVSGLLRGAGFGEGGVDGGQAFVGAHVLGVDGEDRFELFLRDLEISFVAGLQGFGEEQRLARGGVAILRRRACRRRGRGRKRPKRAANGGFFS
jgi:hypothetical protein